MSWILFAQIFALIVLIYLCSRALMQAYFEGVIAAETVVSEKLRENDTLRKQLGLEPYN